MKQYYVVSLKHTSKADTALTLWRPNRAGYTWDVRGAGVYTDDDRPAIETDENVFIDKDLADKFALNGNDYGDKFFALPNDLTVRAYLYLDEKKMKPAKAKTCKMVFTVD